MNTHMEHQLPRLIVENGLESPIKAIAEAIGLEQR